MDASRDDSEEYPQLCVFENMPAYHIESQSHTPNAATADTQHFEMQS
jgi:hypothetical protein